MSDPLAEFRAAQDEEYNTYFATEAIYVGNALAYNTGDGVPISNVRAHGYDKAGLVVKRGSKAAPTAISTPK